MALFTPTQEVRNFLRPSLVAIGIVRIWVLLCPTTIAIEGHAYMARSLGEIEISNNPRLIEWVED
jgi:hypothetical protein